MATGKRFYWIKLKDSFMADDEKALQDGTHQLFAVYGSGSKADAPCDKCKAAHPECDKCCKTCDDHCNAFQLCRKEYGE